MSIERVFYCDGPDCETNVRTASSRPATFLVVTEDAGHSLHFCTWDCVLKHAATKPPVEAIPVAD